MLEPDGSVRSVEYSAGPKTGFTAVVNNEGSSPPSHSEESGRNFIENKSMRDYGKYYDFADEIEDDYYERKRAKRPYDSFREQPSRKRPSYAYDQEPSEYTHSITIKHPRDESSPDGEAHSHVGYSFDPNCKTKTKKESNENRDSYANIVDFDLNKSKYANYPSEPYRDNYDKYSEPSNYAFDKIKPYESYKLPKYEEQRPDSSMKYNYPTVPDIPRPEKYYPEDLPPRPKKKRRPQKVPEYVGDDLDDYILVPKKKYKPIRNPEPMDYRPEFDDEYDRPYQGYDDHEDRYRPIRENSGLTEVVRKVVKKKKPVINLLDIFDI